MRLAASWLGATFSGELVKEARPPQAVTRSAAETLEVVEQMLAAIHDDGLVPVLVSTIPTAA